MCFHTFCTIIAFFKTAIPDLRPIYYIVRIDSDSKRDSIFIKRKNWGITSDSQVIVIDKSSTEFEETDTKTEYIYKGLSDFYYKQSNDTLYIYTSNISLVPDSFHSSFVIVQKEMKPSQMYDLSTNNNYLKEGLKSLDYRYN